jgi:gamma-glutamylcyclotransferase (GGCT)/AIG2-like uncharacterized protein YtfP
MVQNFMINLFTYGSLMCSDIMFKAAGCKMQFSQALLSNFFRSKIRNEEYPGIIPQSGAKVAGVVYFNLPIEAIKRLDVFEGEFYGRQEEVVITENHQSIIAMTYVIKPQYRDLLTGEEWIFTDFLADGKRKFEETYFGFQDISPQ